MSSFVAAIAAVVGWGTVVLVASVIYQASVAEEMRRKRQEQEDAAAAAADAAKGFQFVSESPSSPISVVYGRALIGGAKVYHNTFSSYTYATSPIGDFPYIFVAPSLATLTALPSEQSLIAQLLRSVWNTQNEAALLSLSNLGQSMGGSKHEFLMMQQVIGWGGISAVHNILVDDRRIGGEYVNAYNEAVPKGTAGSTFSNPIQGTARVVISTKGGVADPLMTANDTTRSTAVFTDMAYATCVFKINRDDPQYNGPPRVQFLVKGRAVAPIIGAEGSRYLDTPVFSNNPALILLDYLTNTSFGKGLPLSKIDLDTFYDAAKICERVVMSNVTNVGSLAEIGNVIQVIADQTVTINTPNRTINLYECNLPLDTSKQIRDNVTSILETMNDVSLIWSGGKYKLILDYPLLYSAGTTYQVGEKVQIGTDLYKCIATTTGLSPVADTAHTKWIDAISRYITDDHILRDSNTSINWPNAQSRLNYVTIKFLNESRDFAEDSVVWPPKSSSTYTTMLAQDSGAQLESEQFATGITTYYGALAKAEYLVRSSRTSISYEFSVTRDMFDLEPGDIIKITSDVLNIPGELARVREINPSDGSFKVSAVRFDANSLAWNVADNEPTITRKIYDNALPQVTALTFTNNTSATVASAGLLSWTNPVDNRVISFDIYMAPVGSTLGDLAAWVQVGSVTRWAGSSTTATLPPYNAGFIVAVASRSSTNTSPREGWPTVQPTTGFVVSGNQIALALRLFRRSAIAPGTPTGGTFNFIASTLENIPAGWQTYAYIGNDALYAADAIVTSVNGLDVVTPQWQTPVLISNSALTVNISKNIIAVSQSSTGVINYSDANGQVNVLSASSLVTSLIGCQFTIKSAVNCTAVIDSTQTADKGKYSISNLIAAEGSFVITSTYLGDSIDSVISVMRAGAVFTKDITVPTTPTGLTASTTTDVIFITQTPPAYLMGRGHDYTEIWSATGINAVSGSASKIDEFRGNFYTVPTEPGNLQTLFFKWVSKDGISSAFSSGLNSSGLQITAAQIVDGTLGGTKFASTIEPVTLVTSIPGTKSTNNIFNTVTGKLYNWNGTSYVVVSSAAADISGQLAAAQIATGAITTLKIANDAVTATQIATDAITTPKIAANAITAAKIAADTITANEIAAGAITVNELAANSVTAAKIVANTITATQIAANTITANEIAADTITAGQIAAGAITATELAANAVTAGKIAAGTIVANDIAANTITAGKMSVTSLSSLTANLGTITGGELTISGAGGAPTISGTTMTGEGAHLYSDGRFAMGNASRNIVNNGSVIRLNGFTPYSSVAYNFPATIYNPRVSVAEPTAKVVSARVMAGKKAIVFSSGTIILTWDSTLVRTVQYNYLNWYRVTGGATFYNGMATIKEGSFHIAPGGMASYFIPMANMEVIEAPTEGATIDMHTAIWIEIYDASNNPVECITGVDFSNNVTFLDLVL